MAGDRIIHRGDPGRRRMSSTIRIAGVDYPGVPSVTLKDPGGNSIAFPDVSGDTVTAATLRAGVTAHAADGAQIEGSYVPSYADAHDTGWNIVTVPAALSIPLITSSDLSSALTIDISALTFHPRLILLEPATNAQAEAVTAPDETYHRFLFSMNEISETGERKTAPGYACIFLETTNLARKASNNIGLYPDSDWSVLRLVAYATNAVVDLIRIKRGNWRWRGIG